MKLKGKIIIKGQFETLTGLHIGGSKSALAIGGIDNSVIKTAKDRPYIPGSSIKGKLRSLLAKVEGSLFFSEKDQETEQKVVRELLRKDNPKIDIGKATKYGELIKKEGLNDEDYPYIMDLFGYSGDNDNAIGVHYTRLLVRDAFMDEAAWKADFSEDTEVTHGKWENVINRRTGTAEHPRQMERVPAGAKFNFELVYSVYEEEGEDTTATLNEHIKRLLLALQLLQDDGIGGQLSRGYGQVKVHLKDIIQKEIKDYQYEVTKLSDSATFDINNPQQLLEAIKH